MIMSRKQFDELLSRYDMSDADAENAFDFVHDVLALEEDLTEQNAPEAFNTINRLNNAAYVVFETCGDVSGERFDEV